MWNDRKRGRLESETDTRGSQHSLTLWVLTGEHQLSCSLPHKQEGNCTKSRCEYKAQLKSWTSGLVGKGEPTSNCCNKTKGFKMNKSLDFICIVLYYSAQSQASLVCALFKWVLLLATFTNVKGKRLPSFWKMVAQRCNWSPVRASSTTEHIKLLDH